MTTFIIQLLNVTVEYFANKHQMHQEACNNCFRSKQRNTALPLENIDKHESSKAANLYKMENNGKI